MLEFERVSLLCTVECFAFDQAKDKRFRHKTVEDVIFSQRRVPSRIDEGFAFNTTGVDLAEIMSSSRGPKARVGCLLGGGGCGVMPT